MSVGVRDNGGQAAVPPYSCRFGLFGRERTFRLAPDGLAITGGRRDVVLAYRDIARVWLSQAQHQSWGAVERCQVKAGGKTVVLQSLHVAGLLRFSDRAAQYEPFILALVQGVVAANPAVAVWVGTPGHSRAGWFFALILVGLLALAGIAQVVSGEWDGLWLVGTALTAGPLGLSMLGKGPARRLGPRTILSATDYRGLVR